MGEQGIISDYRAVLSASITAVVQYMADGKCKSYDDYLARVAEIRAYHRSGDHFSQVIADYYRSDETNQGNTLNSEENSER